MYRISLPNYLLNAAREVFALLHKYRPETRLARKLRLKKRAADQAAGKDTILTKKTVHLRQGINKVTTLVEQKKAKLVVISHDVEPIEVCFNEYLVIVILKIGAW